MPGTLDHFLNLLSRYHPVCLATSAFPRCLLCSCHPAESGEIDTLYGQKARHRVSSLVDLCKMLLTFQNLLKRRMFIVRNLGLTQCQPAASQCSAVTCDPATNL